MVLAGTDTTSAQLEPSVERSIVKAFSFEELSVHVRSTLLPEAAAADRLVGVDGALGQRRYFSHKRRPVICGEEETLFVEISMLPTVLYFSGRNSVR